MKSTKKIKSSNAIKKDQNVQKFNCLPLTSQFENTKAIDKMINLKNDALNEFHHHDLNQDKLIFNNDAQKLLFNNDLNGVLPNTGNLEIDSIDLNLNNLNSNLDVNLTNNLTNGSLSNSLHTDLNNGLNSLSNNNLNNNLNTNLNSNLNSNLEKLNFDFESQSNQSLLL